MKTIEEIKGLIKCNELTVAIEELHTILKVDPENVEAGVLLSTCCQMNGDSLTLGSVCDDVGSQLEPCEQSDERLGAVSPWKLWVLILALACLLVGLVSRQMRVNDLEAQMETAVLQLERMDGELHKERSSCQEAEARVNELGKGFERSESELHVAEARLKQAEESLARTENSLKQTKENLSLAEDRVCSAERAGVTSAKNLQDVTRRLQAAENMVGRYKELREKEGLNYGIVRDYISRSMAEISKRSLKQFRVDCEVSDLPNLCSEVLKKSQIDGVLRDLGFAVLLLPARPVERRNSLFDCDSILFLRLHLDEDCSEDSLRRGLVKSITALAGPIPEKHPVANASVANVRKTKVWNRNDRSNVRVIYDDDEDDILNGGRFNESDRMEKLRKMIPHDWGLNEASWVVEAREVERKTDDDSDDDWQHESDDDWQYEHLPRMRIIKPGIRKLSEVAGSLKEISHLVVRKTESEVILAVKFENVIYTGEMLRAGVMDGFYFPGKDRDYGERLPKRILALDGTVIYSTRW